MPLTPTPKIWMNGTLVDWDQATIHVGTHTLHYGTGIYEGVRADETADGPGLFRLTPHIERFYRSAKILGMPMTYSVPEIVDACKVVVRSTGLESCYVRPLAYYGYGHMGLDTEPCDVDIAIMAWPWASVRGDATNAADVRMMVSSWRRHGLEGITQDTVKRIANDLGFDLRESQLSRSDLYVADEIFVCGTASEVSAVQSVDGREVAFPGYVGSAIQTVFTKAVRGEEPQYAQWVEVAA